MAGNQNEPAPWEAQRPPAPSYPGQPQPPQQPGYQNPYQQAGGAYPQQQQPYGGPGYGQNPMYGQQPAYNPQAFTQPFGGQQPFAGPQLGYYKPHRGTTLIILTVCSFAVCAICGVVGFFMAKNDLAEIKAGTMDPAGEQMTKVAYWVCLCHFCFVAFVIVAYMILMAVVFSTAPSHSGRPYP
jgi:hypothetical protein